MCIVFLYEISIDFKVKSFYNVKYMIYLTSSTQAKQIFSVFFQGIENNELNGRVTQKAQELFSAMERAIPLRKLVCQVVISVGVLLGCLSVFKQNIALSLLSFITSLVAAKILYDERSREEELVLDDNIFNNQEKLREFLISLAAQGKKFEDLVENGEDLYNHLKKKNCDDELKFLLQIRGEEYEQKVLEQMLVGAVDRNDFNEAEKIFNFREKYRAEQLLKCEGIGNKLSKLAEKQYEQTCALQSNGKNFQLSQMLGEWIGFFISKGCMLPEVLKILFRYEQFKIIEKFYDFSKVDYLECETWSMFCKTLAEKNQGVNIEDLDLYSVERITEWLFGKDRVLQLSGSNEVRLPDVWETVLDVKPFYQVAKTSDEVTSIFILPKGWTVDRSVYHKNTNTWIQTDNNCSGSLLCHLHLSKYWPAIMFPSDRTYSNDSQKKLWEDFYSFFKNEPDENAIIAKLKQLEGLNPLDKKFRIPVIGRKPEQVSLPHFFLYHGYYNAFFYVMNKIHGDLDRTKEFSVAGRHLYRMDQVKALIAAENKILLKEVTLETLLESPYISNYMIHLLDNLNSVKGEKDASHNEKNELILSLLEKLCQQDLSDDIKSSLFAKIADYDSVETACKCFKITPDMFLKCNLTEFEKQLLSQGINLDIANFREEEVWRKTMEYLLSPRYLPLQAQEPFLSPEAMDRGFSCYNKRFHSGVLLPPDHTHTYDKIKHQYTIKNRDNEQIGILNWSKKENNRLEFIPKDSPVVHVRKNKTKWCFLF